MDASTEIRKMTPRSIKLISQILDESGQWQCLMNIIPMTLERDCYHCEVSPKNPQKYNSEHVRLIERESNESKKKCTEILFEEWGTSGRIRPTLGHLLHLLVKGKLFRAADYIAVELLNQERPRRLSTGPEGVISASRMQAEIEDFTITSDEMAIVSPHELESGIARNVIQHNSRVSISDVNKDVISGFTTPLVSEGAEMVDVSNRIEFSEFYLPVSESYLPDSDIIANRGCRISY